MSVITSLILWTLRKPDILGFEVLMQLPKEHGKPTCNGCFWMFMFPFMEHSHIQWCYLKKSDILWDNQSYWVLAIHFTNNYTKMNISKGHKAMK